jgi:hypothetical protein
MRRHESDRLSDGGIANSQRPKPDERAQKREKDHFASGKDLWLKKEFFFDYVLSWN